MKKQLLGFAFTALLIKLLLITQFATAQNSRIWGTFYGGGNGESGNGVVTDATRNVYMTGETNSTNNISFNGFQDTLFSSDGDAFLTKFDANGNRLWATYYGGEAEDRGMSVATDAAGNVYIAGTTLSKTNIAEGGFYNTFSFFSGNQPNHNAFLVKFDANGNRLWATYYGGYSTTANAPGDTYGNAIATDAAGDVYLAGNTNADTGIASGGFQNTYGGDNSGNNGDAFLVKFDADGNRLWATYYGGSQSDAGYGVATDNSGNVYLAGATTSRWGISSGGFQNSLAGLGDAFLVKFDHNGNRLWATYYGGENSDQASGVTTDSASNVYLTGNTSSYNNIGFNGFQDTLVGAQSAFLAKFNTNGDRQWATYYGGANVNGVTVSTSVAADVSGNVWMAGVTISDSGIASGGYNNIYPVGSAKASFLVKFDPIGTRQCATYYGGALSKIEQAFVALDNLGYVYLTGAAESDSTIAYNGFQDTYGGGSSDAMLIKFTNCEIAPVVNFQSSDTIFCAYNCINYTDLSINNATSWQWSFPGATPSSSTMQNPQNICYYSTGVYEAKLIASNSGGSDSLTVINFIHVVPVPPTPVITQDHDTLFCSTDPSYTSYQWYDYTALIPGATDTFLVITHAGNYNVAVHNEYGCYISVGINIVQGIQNYSNDNHIVLSPNPATDQLLISGNWKSGEKLTIFNILGEIIYTQETNSEQETLNCKPFPVGIYFVQVANERERWIGRFVKE